MVQFIESPIVAILKILILSTRMKKLVRVAFQFVRSFAHLSQWLANLPNHWFADTQMNISSGYVKLQEKVYLMLMCIRMGEANQEFSNIYIFTIYY